MVRLKRKPSNFNQLVLENIIEIKRDKNLLQQIETKIENKYLKEKKQIR
ncbi:FbpB family small basic protein [Bacillus sp. OK048]|nr:FbpB family small basic protein [Bacillus sp. OK048]SDL96673.1 Fur-regulated basic protein B [Bacillus sp. OK048]